jgi:hypothetical protein
MTATISAICNAALQEEYSPARHWDLNANALTPCNAGRPGAGIRGIA